MTVYCSNIDCIHCDGCMCGLDVISVGDEYEYGCADYEDYLNTIEYGTEFFICVKMPDGNVAKAKRKGKRIEYNGYVFYTTDNDKSNYHIFVTEERTGIGCGIFERLKTPERWQKFISSVSKCRNVEELPLAIFNPKTKKFEYEKTTERQQSKEG